MDAPPAAGSRRPWSSLPVEVLRAIEAEVGVVRRAEDRSGGFSPGVAAVLDLADGDRVFVKATSSELNPVSPRLYRDEARIASQLPAAVPAPRLRSSMEIGSWVALVFDAVAGHSPALPWNSEQLQQVLDLTASLPALLTPCPIDVPGVAERFANTFTGWRNLAAAPSLAAGLSPWTRRNLDRLASLEIGWAEALVGDTLLHSDLRADNLLLDGERCWIVDWPWACRGAAWFELLGMLPSVVMQSGPPLTAIIDRHPVFAGVDPDAITIGLTALVGYFIDAGLRPPPPGLPTLRAFQTGQGLAGLPGLIARLDGR